jgi:hypothetical protein
MMYLKHSKAKNRVEKLYRGTTFEEAREKTCLKYQTTG